MREILFRGKRKDNGEWVCGMPWIFKEKSCICPWKKGMCKYDTGFYPVEVDPDTVGQYTGLMDKNGKKIFEGDIVDVMHEGVYKCRWDEGNFEFGLSNGNESFGLAYVSPYDIVVIGNIHDDPELLEE